MTPLMTSNYLLNDRLHEDAREVLDIYEQRFPNHRIRIVLYQGLNPIWGEPVIVHGKLAIEPRHLTPEYIGYVNGGNADPLAPPVTIFVSIPRKPNPVEQTMTEPDWHPRSRALSLIYRFSPMAYERLRYRAERRQEARSRQHAWKSLPRGAGSPIFLPTKPPSDAAPAILIGVHWLEVGGAEKLALDCVQWAREAGLRVFVVASVPSIQRLAEKLPEDVQFLRFDRYLAHDQWAQALEELIQKENICLIHIHHCVPLYAALAHIRMIAPWVHIMDSTHIIEYADGGYPRISGVWSNYIDTHHVISNQLADMYRNRFHTGNKIRLGRMLGPREEVASLPAPNMKAGKEAIEVTFVGRLYYQKRPITAILIMKALADWAKKTNVRILFNFVGAGPFAAACEQLIARLELSELVVRHQAHSDVRAILKRSDIMLLPSSNEGLALVCYEAIEMGAIPIATNVGAQREIVPEGLLTSRDPATARDETVQIVDRLWKDQNFMEQQALALHQRYYALAADPTAQDVITEVYRAAAMASDPEGR